MIIPVLLCGGRGTRLWPMSRQSFPKQFSSLNGSATLLQDAVSALVAAGATAPVVVTANEYRFIVAEQMRAADVTPAAILLEPEAKGTKASILTAALHAQAQNVDAALLIVEGAPILPDIEALGAALRAAAEAATGDVHVGFEDAPGLTVVRADALIAAADDTELSAVRAALEAAKAELDFLRLDAEFWAAAPAGDMVLSASVQQGLDTAWTDAANWNAVWHSGVQDVSGVVTRGEVQAIDCADSLLRSESENLELVGLGLDGIIAVATPDAVLVADKSRADDVHLAVAALTAKGSKQAAGFPKDHRPWGWFESLVIGGRYQVKRICVHPGASLSLQSHHHRADHWIVVEGTASVTVNDEIKLVSENQSVYLPLGCIHRMENPGKVPMVLIEVQIGSYVGEDDIIRYEDVYARS